MLTPYQITNHFGKFKLRVKDVTRGRSKTKEDGTGNDPQDVVEFELIDNPPVVVKNPDTGENESVDVNGVTVKQWVTYNPKTPDMVNRFLDAIEMPAIPAQDQHLIDGNMFKGKTALGLVNFKTRPMKGSDGQVIMNDHTGKPMSTGDIQLSQLLPRH